MVYPTAASALARWARHRPWSRSLAGAAAIAAAITALPPVLSAPIGGEQPDPTVTTPVAPAEADSAPLLLSEVPPPTAPAAEADDVQRLRQQLLIPAQKRLKRWASPSLSPGVPSAFIAKWGDVYAGVSAATPGRARAGVADGSFVLGFGLGDLARSVAVDISGGCGSIKSFCSNGAFDVKVGRLFLDKSAARLAVALGWQNAAQWGIEGPQDDTFYGVATYAVPLRRSSNRFGQTLQFSAGMGNSRYAPYVSNGSAGQLGVFASAGLELSPNTGISAGWSGRGANAQLSWTPIRGVPLSVNVLGADLFNQTPAGTVGVLSLGWGTNFRTATF